VDTHQHITMTVANFCAVPDIGKTKLCELFDAQPPTVNGAGLVVSEACDASLETSQKAGAWLGKAATAPARQSARSRSERPPPGRRTGPR
jgi:hypothetical protein